MTVRYIRASVGEIDIAVHDLAGGVGSPGLLFSHATGFHARCYAPVAQGLADRFCSVGLDHRGHGATPQDGDPVADWSRFGDDTLTVARVLADRTGGPITGFGHSMGGAALLLATDVEPDLFERLVLFEPIAMPPRAEPVDMDSMPIVIGARRRRPRFDSFADAYANYRSKPPLSTLTADALRLYVDHGFRPVDAAAPDGEVELCCAPEYEASVFTASHANGVWDRLPAIETPALLVSGRVEQDQPSGATAQIAERMPNGTAIELPDLDHFGPLTHPDRVAAIIAGS